MSGKSYPEYLVDGDLEVIKKWMNNKNTSFSIRAAGHLTIECLKRGAGAKPHSILEKKLKKSQLLKRVEVS